MQTFSMQLAPPQYSVVHFGAQPCGMREIRRVGRILGIYTICTRADLVTPERNANTMLWLCDWPCSSTAQAQITGTTRRSKSIGGACCPFTMLRSAHIYLILQFSFVMILEHDTVDNNTDHISNQTRFRGGLKGAYDILIDTSKNYVDPFLSFYQTKTAAKVTRPKGMSSIFTGYLVR